MRDFLPADKRRRDDVLAVIADRYRQHGFDAIETPALEDFETLHSGLGGDNEKLSFHVLRRGLETSELKDVSSVDQLADLGLRFDLTVPLARYVASHRSELPGVFRALHIAPVWRAERPQKGRFRQFVQCDIDIVGESTSLAEREVLMATADVLSALGVEDYQFRVNDRRLLQGVLDSAGVTDSHRGAALVIIDKLDKVGREGVLSELSEMGSAVGDLAVFEALLSGAATAGDLDRDRIAGMMSVSAELAGELADWATDVASLIGPDRVVFDPTLVRGMGYYTGSIVELAHPGLGVSLGGGGRYDGMIGRFLGEDIPAFGFSLGFERLIDLVDADWQDRAESVALVFDDTAAPRDVLGLKAELVASGAEVRLARARKNRKALYAELEQAGCARVAEVGVETPLVGELEWRELGSGK